jgi:hypothetical protein
MSSLGSRIKDSVVGDCTEPYRLCEEHHQGISSSYFIYTNGNKEDLLSSLEEGHIYGGPLNISRSWIYLGVFNCLEASPLGNGLYKCVVMENEPKFMDYELKSRIVSRFNISSEIRLTGCTLENLVDLLESHKFFYREASQNPQFYNPRFHDRICEYIKALTMSKDNIRLPKDFEIVSSDNDSLILLNKRR